MVQKAGIQVYLLILVNFLGPGSISAFPIGSRSRRVKLVRTGSTTLSDGVFLLEIVTYCCAAFLWLCTPCSCSISPPGTCSDPSTLSSSSSPSSPSSSSPSGKVRTVPLHPRYANVQLLDILSFFNAFYVKRFAAMLQIRNGSFLIRI